METFLYLNGLALNGSLPLGKNCELQSVSCSPTPDQMIQTSKHEIDLGIAMIFLRHVKSQIRLIADNQKDLAVRAWNCQWDALILSAFCHCDVKWNLECDTSADKFSANSKLRIVHYHFYGIPEKIHFIDSEKAVWLEQNFDRVRKLLDNDAFRSGVHSMASYRWNSHPRSRLAILWSGIEGLFEVDSELVFRLSLYISRFLEPCDDAGRKEVFNKVKRLYKQRSLAIHGSELKGESVFGVEESAQLLLRILNKCVLDNSIPQKDKLAP